MRKLQGYKTYLMAGLAGVVTVLKGLGYLDETTFQVLMGLLGAGGLATLRAGVTKSGPKA